MTLVAQLLLYDVTSVAIVITEYVINAQKKNRGWKLPGQGDNWIFAGQATLVGKFNQLCFCYPSKVIEQCL